MDRIQFSSPIDDRIKFEMEWGKHSFKPTATSEFLIKSIYQNIDEPVETLLDLGCGIGVVGIALMKHGIAKKLFASDITPESVQLTDLNCRNNRIEVEARTSNVLDNWENKRFNIIANDISGVAVDVAQKSSWFNNVPVEAGVDGTALILNVLKNAKNHLNDDGTLFFPIISLSNEKKIIEEARSIFATVEKISSNPWFLPDDLANEIELLETLASHGHINFDVKFGKVICYTDIYLAR